MIPARTAIPSEVDLTTFLTVQDFDKAAVFRGSLGTSFQKAADGILNKNRPSIGVSISSPSPLFADGKATADMEVQMNNTSLDISRDGIVISGLGTGTKFEGDYTIETAILLNQILGTLFWEILATDEAGNISVFRSNVANTMGGTHPVDAGTRNLTVFEAEGEATYWAHVSEESQNNPFRLGTSDTEKALDFDFDHDGVPHGPEVAAGTNPDDPNDFPRTWIYGNLEDGFQFNFWPFYSGHLYIVKQSSDLQEFKCVATEPSFAFSSTFGQTAAFLLDFSLTNDFILNGSNFIKGEVTAGAGAFSNCSY